MDMDPEIQAMNKILEALSNLDEIARERVLRWAADRYAVSSGTPTGIERAEDQNNEIGSTEFGYFSELFDAADPSTEWEKVLVASYWFQEIEGYSEVEAFTVNKALKQLGHGIGNVTREFARAQAEKPSFIFQVKKKGSTKQARKKYKVTDAGIRKVKNMISRTGE